MVRAYLVSAKPKKLGHAVMLGSPYKGSKVVDVMQALAGFLGPCSAGGQLGC